MKRTFIYSILIVIITTIYTNKYQPCWASLDQRIISEWFSHAKFGIFVHWEIYSVPG